MIRERPVEGVTTDTRSHPAGRDGSMISLKEVAERAWKARMSPRLRAWVGQTITAAGVASGGHRQKMQAILDEYRRKVTYANDPLMGEFIATPDQVLCLDKDRGLCIPIADCDEASVVLVASALCLGFSAMVVGSSHKPPLDVPTHVFGAFQDEIGDWVKVDGTTKHPVGRTSPHAREWWVEPGAEAKERGEGDFVGMAGGADVGMTGSRRVGVSGGATRASAPASTIDLLYPSIRR